MNHESESTNNKFILPVVSEEIEKIVPRLLQILKNTIFLPPFREPTKEARSDCID